MANTVIEFDTNGRSGLTLTADVHAPLSDTLLASGKTCTEQTNRKGVYRFTMSENVTGLNIVRIKNGTSTFGALPIDPMLADDANTYEASDRFVDVKQWLGTKPATPATAGVPNINVVEWRGSTPAVLADTDKVPVSVQHMATDSLSAAAMSIGAADKVADHVWDESSLVHVGVNSFGALIVAIKTQVDANGTAIEAVQNNTRVVRVVPQVIERPDSGTQEYRIELLLYDEVSNMEAPDSAPTIALVDQGGTDLSARLDSATMSLVSTGRYRAVYTASDDDDLEQLVWAFSVVEGGNTRIYGNTTIIVDTTAVDFTSSDRTLLQAAATEATALLVKAKTDNLPASPAATSDIPAASAIADAVCDEALSGHATAGTVGKALSDTLADTNELQGDWADGGRLDDLLDTAATGGGGGGGTTADDVQQAVWDNIPNDGVYVTVLGPVVESDGITIVSGDDYNNSDDRAIEFTITGQPTLVDATIKFSVYEFDDGAGVAVLEDIIGMVVDATHIYIELTSAQTALLSPDSNYRFDIQATLATSGRIVTLTNGVVNVNYSWTSP